MKLSYCLTIFNFMMPLVASFMDIELVLAFFKAKHLNRNVVLTCYEKPLQIRLLKNLTQNTIVTVKRMKNLNILDTLMENYKRMGMVVDGDCPEAKGLLMRCKRYNVFDTKHFWLVTHNSGSYDYLFRFVNLNVNSDVKVAYPNPHQFATYVIDDVYNPAYLKRGGLKTSEVGFYDANRGYRLHQTQNKYFTRRNLTGIQFNTLVVLTQPFQGPLREYLESDDDTKVNTFSRFHARLMHYCQDYYNFSMQIAVDESLGFLQTDGTMDGLVGSMERKIVDFGLSPLFYKKERAQFITYGRKTWNLYAAFILRNPKSRKSYQIFINPLSFHVWVCIVMVSVLSVFSQKLGYVLDKRINLKSFRMRNLDDSYSFSTVCTFGAFCQQGIIAFPDSISGRTAAYVTLLLGMLIYQFYSASLVSFLLNTPVTLISNVKDILDNGFQIGAEDVLYAKSLFQAGTDNVTREVYKRLSISMDNRSGFIQPTVGLDLVTRGHYAFHVELATAYPIIESTYDETTICDLKEVSIFGEKHMYAAYQKWSPFKDLMDVCLQRFAENGVLRRELIFWHPKKPTCMRSSSTIRITIGLEDFYPALVVLMLGIVLSLQILVYELLWHKNKKLDKVKDTWVIPFTN
ncbi:ionotropic receptor 75a-like [Anthonomus grandis grandis]|uniref:ionotropic receptor 75a-like n=1 Tax=Anthonomus grandis grandis TaxID=2921223 RepID=UPI002165AABC|nr:ionotropic receptor 75a-like [Anthonomus grandis grandis]